jgi:hypothetical protein
MVTTYADSSRRASVSRWLTVVSRRAEAISYPNNRTVGRVSYGAPFDGVMGFTRPDADPKRPAGAGAAGA